MSAGSAGKLIVRVAFIFATLVLACHAFALDNAQTPVQALQALAAQIKLASDQADAGLPPSAASLSAFERALAGFGSASTGADARLQDKYRAVALLFGKVKYQSSNPSSAQAKPATPSHATTDVEVVTDRHGASCTTALGISAALPVAITLAQSGDRGSDAWFRFEPAATGHFLFKTNSSGADPALQIFRGGCAADAALVGSNDDSFGLDAAVSVAAPDRAGLIVHVTNSAKAGPLALSVNDVNSTIAGKITDAATGLALATAQVEIFDGNGNYQGVSGSTDQNGNYALSVSPGTYYVRAFDNQYNNQYVSALYPNAQCGYNSYYYNISGCAITQALTVSVASGATASNINIALSAGQRISGVVRDGLNAPVTAASVILYDNFGRYSFFTLPAGAYKLSAQAGGYGMQMFDHVACNGSLQTQCDLSRAGVINVTSQDISGANFNLPLLATIQGNVTGSGFQPGYYNAQVSVLDTGGNGVAQAYVDANGHYTAGPLAIGNYYVYITATGYFSQIFDAVDCAQDCYASIPAATQIAIAQNGQVGTADFHLTPLPSVHGHIQDASSGAPLANVTVAASIYPPAQFSAASSTVTDGNGDYTLQNTPAGKFYVWAQSADHVDQVYSGIACEAYDYYYYSAYPPCDVTGATALTISPGQTPSAFDFALQASSSISGQAIIRAGPGSDLPALVQINVYNGAGVVVASVNTDSLGNYVVGDLAAGTYYVSAGNYYYSQYITQIWQLMDCPDSCAATMGTPVVVGQTAAVTGIDFLVTRRDIVVGRVTDAAGDPISGVLMDLFDSASHNYLATSATDTQGYYAVGWNQGSSYFVATEVAGGYVDQIYSDVSCPQGPAYFGLCPFTNAAAIPLGYGSTQPHIANFVLQSNDPLFSNGFESP
jgi:5-hydroxyisourate hydrolase-like protein (transthyretin family)